jgi:hypothetical protein
MGRGHLKLMLSPRRPARAGQAEGGLRRLIPVLDGSIHALIGAPGRQRDRNLSRMSE